MKKALRRPLGLSLTGQILGLAALNLVLPVVVTYLLITFQLVSVESLLTIPASDKMFAITRDVDARLRRIPQAEWDAALADFGRHYNVRIYLTTPESHPIAGVRDPLPRPVRARFPPPGPPGGRIPPPITGEPPDGRLLPPRRPPPSLAPPPPVYVVATSGPRRYWAGARMPLPNQGTPAMLILESDSAFNPKLFFDVRMLVVVFGGIVGFSGLLWWPFLRGLTRAIGAMDRAALRIAEGQLETRVAASRGDEIGHLGEQINRMAGRLSGYVVGQKRFLGDIAHELSAPIARVQVGLAIAGQRAQSDTDQARRLAEIQEEVEQLAALVQELLQFSKSALVPSVELASVNVVAAAQTALEREASGCGEVRLEVPTGLSVVANEALFTRSLANLVRNSMRYARGAGPIEISARAEGGDVLITVSDRGPGVPEELLETIFEPFYRREESRSRSTGGVGLGLAIVKSAIESCQGSVICRNRKPSGLETVIRLKAC